MANDVKRRFHSFLPGAGYDANGNPKQGKTRVVGRIEVTSYTRGGEELTPTSIGLTAIDHLSLRPVDETGDPSGATKREARTDLSQNVFYLVDIGETGTPTEYSAGATETLEFQAEGDSAWDVELL